MFTERLHSSAHLSQVWHSARGSCDDEERSRRERRRQERTDTTSCGFTLQPLGHGHSATDQQGQSTQHGQGQYQCPLPVVFQVSEGQLVLPWFYFHLF